MVGAKKCASGFLASADFRPGYWYGQEVLVKSLTPAASNLQIFKNTQIWFAIPNAISSATGCFSLASSSTLRRTSAYTGMPQGSRIPAERNLSLALQPDVQPPSKRARLEPQRAVQVVRTVARPIGTAL